MSGTIWLKLPRGIRVVGQSLHERLAVLGVPGVAPSYLVTVLFLTAVFQPFIYLASLTTGLIGVDRSAMPLVVLAFGAGSVIGNFGGGWLADRFGTKITIAGSISVMALLMLLMSTLPLLPRGTTGGAWLGYMFVFGLVAFTFPPAQMTRLASLAPASAPLVLSLNGTANNTGAALAAAIGGIVLERIGTAAIGPTAALFALAALAVVGMMEFLRRRARKNASALP